MVLIDEEGNSIHAQVYPPTDELFKNRVKEGGVYTFSYFRVRASNIYYKPVENEEMLVFTKWTKVEEVLAVPPAFPMYAYSIASQEQLQARIDSRAQFTDVIGVITAISNTGTTQTKLRQGDSTKRTVTIQTPSNILLDVVLWSEHATAFPADEILKGGQTSPQVVLFVGTLVKSFGGMSLSGSSSCKWYINLDIPDTKKLLARV
ncbi:replication protein A 70 kDa DNA-binding subunit B-like isoform X2 [Panicum virgatum]|uniref:replication protein A 70 kDa DNA-binding subunit B-like isoform X2 n=1 Tax=Panicum virgatum TaxID=38727 RepID=UPI0019D5629C|nr:replication protein A 70 kDa DNA-binding subunit B-like isoform X2 [Panicum virgatum]